MGFSAYEVFYLINKKDKFKNSDLFVVTNPSFSNFKKILESVKKTKNIYLFDDSRSQKKS